MSHLTEVKPKWMDLDSIEEAAGHVGMVLERDRTAFKWYGRVVGDTEEGRRIAMERGAENLGKCDHVLRSTRGDGHEVGVVREPDGSYALLYDTWGPGAWIERAAGPGLERLQQEYSVAVATKRAQPLVRQGWRLERKLEGTTVRLQLLRRRR